MALLRTRKLRAEHGVVEAEAEGVWLGSDGKKNLVDAYEAACQRSVTGALPGYSGSWRRHIAHSAQMLARAIAADVEDAVGFAGGFVAGPGVPRVDADARERFLLVAKTLESWGYRIQESVFQLRLDTATLARVRFLLAALISDAEDVIHIYPICSSCADHADILGAAIALDDVGLCRGVW